jgi:hypothetical protein
MFKDVWGRSNDPSRGERTLNTVYGSFAARCISTEAQFHQDDSGEKADRTVHPPKHPVGIQPSAQIPNKNIGVEHYLAGDY